MDERRSAFAYGVAALVAAALVGGGIGFAGYFRTHLGAPPQIVIVAGASPAATTAAPSSTRVTTTTAPTPAVVAEPIPPSRPDSAAYTAVVPDGLPGFANPSANHYGWFGGDGVSARCDEWNRAQIVGMTAQTLFVVCAGPSGWYFKGFELASSTPIRTDAARSGAGIVSSGDGSAISLTRDTLTLNGSDAQAVVAWWTPDG
ncbi:hypothetical protein AB0M22_14000 [Nocardia sp. NPDC051756]|uniref:hypothetical protein n=1 Tax=Nocardia sp. NPDC051756 TaxID=3154751 RepID=UPI0034223B96